MTATIYHLDASGNLIETAYVGLGIDGLAYNPTTRHLFADAGRRALGRLGTRTADGYGVLGGFRVDRGGCPFCRNGALESRGRLRRAPLSLATPIPTSTPSNRARPAGA